jgi:hypothetical protein
MLLQLLPVMVVLTGQAVPPPTAPPATVRPATQVVGAAPVQSPRPVPKTYNETADAKAAIESAVHAANTDDVRALVVWGANDNERCAAFDVTRRSRDLGTAWSDEYKLAFVDVGRADRNVDLAKSYGVTLAADSLPALTILDQKGKVLANLSSRDLAAADGAGFDSKKLAAFLTSHQAPQPDATAQFEAALKQAKSEGKTLFVWFSAPW